MDIKKDFPILENKNIAYLDSGATTQKPIQVIKAVEEFYEKYKIWYSSNARIKEFLGKFHQGEE